jgi:hypothetical protein
VKIMVLDPGGGTGYALWNGSLDEPWNPDDVVMGAINDKEHHYKLEQLLLAELTNLAPRVGLPRIAVPDARLVYEGFDHTDNRAAELISLEYIGVAKAVAQKYGITIFRASRAGKDLAYLKGKALKDFGLWPQSKDAKDAARHLIWHLLFVLNFQDLLFYRERTRSGI